MPEHVRVAAGALGDGHLAPARVGLEAPRAVQAVVDDRPVGAREDQDRVVRPVLEPGDVGGVHHAVARPQVARVHAGLERDRLLRPVHQVRAGGVPPVHGVPAQPVRVVLVEEVVLPAVEERAVGVVHPAGARAEMELAAQRLVVSGGRIGELRMLGGGAGRRGDGRQDQGENEGGDQGDAHPSTIGICRCLSGSR